MTNIMNKLYNLRFLDDMARGDTIIHRIHPLSKLLTTFVFLLVVVSFEKYDISGLLPLLFYPVIILVLSEVPPTSIINRVLIVLPLVIGIGILNPIFDTKLLAFGDFRVTAGWITFISIIIKSILTVSVALILIATTGIDKLGAALRILHVPRIFVLQLLLTYRYLSVLGEEVARTVRAYSLRAPGHKGIKMPAWGSLMGQILLRTYDRAQRVYQAMCIRGFTGEYEVGVIQRIRLSDICFMVIWSIFFVIMRIYNINELIGSIVTGG